MNKMKFSLSSLLCAAILLSGCHCPFSPAQDKDIVVRVNDYGITREEFEEEFKSSPYGRTDTPENREDFLNSLIDRKLILQYAQQKGFDREKAFLKSIEKFWEQSLLKAALDKKTKEIESNISASGWEKRREEENKMMSDWVNELRRGAHITVKGGVLKSGADKPLG